MSSDAISLSTACREILALRRGPEGQRARARVAGRRLFKASTDFSASRQVMELPIPVPSTLNSAVSPALDRVVMRALERDLGARYASAEDMAFELERVVQDERLPAHEHGKPLNDLFPHEPSVTNVEIVSVSEAAGGTAEPSATADAAPARAPVGGWARSGATVATVADPAAMGGRGGRAATPTRATMVPAAPSTRHLAGETGARVGRAALLAAALVGLGASSAIRHSSRAHLERDPGQDVAPGKGDRREAPLGTEEPLTVPLVRWSIDSEPQDATVTRVEDGLILGRTPFTIAFPRSEKAIPLRFERPGAPPVLRKVIPDLDKVVRVELSEPNDRNADGDASGTLGARPPSPRRRTATSIKALHDATPINPFKM